MQQLRPYQIQAVKETWEALKDNNEPVLLMASVGAGKSIMLASILLTMQKAGKKALCLVNNAELCQNNAKTFVIHGGNASIYCAALNSKDTQQSIIFGTPQSILNGVLKDEEISRIKFNLIVVDEAHCISFNNHRGCFMRILRHFYQRYNELRVLGATGTNFRFKGHPIVGKDCLFKTQVGNITTEQLIRDGYLVKPIFEVDPNLVLDFSHVKVKQNGLFDQQQLAKVIDDSPRLTELICKQIVHIMETQQRKGVFIFATTKKHAHEILSHLPKTQNALILGETKQGDRNEILENARIGNIRYLVNISIISVGVDVPAYDTIAYLRPTESLVLLVQTMGRALRLSPSKTEALILDFAGNIERHSHWDDPILLDAVKQTIDLDKPLVILCPKCNTMNTEHTRRCTGMTNKRCDYYFEYKDCPNEQCKVQNDITARNCWSCGVEIIDPNAKLSLDKIQKYKDVIVDSYNFQIRHSQSSFYIVCTYHCFDYNGRSCKVNESYSPSSLKAQHVLYGQFIRHHCKNPYKWYPHLSDEKQMQKMLNSARVPIKLLLDKDKIKKKVFK